MTLGAKREFVMNIMKEGKYYLKEIIKMEKEKENYLIKMEKLWLISKLEKI